MVRVIGYSYIMYAIQIDRRIDLLRMILLVIAWQHIGNGYETLSTAFQEFHVEKLFPLILVHAIVPSSRNFETLV